MCTSPLLADRTVLHTFVTEIPGVGTHTGVLFASLKHDAVAGLLVAAIVDAPLPLDVAAVALAEFVSPLLVEVKVVGKLGGQSADGQVNVAFPARFAQT